MDREFVVRNLTDMCNLMRDNRIPDEDDYPHLHRDDEVSEDDYEDLTDEEN